MFNRKRNFRIAKSKALTLLKSMEIFRQQRHSRIDGGGGTILIALEGTNEKLWPV